jgi:hypothetical protein
MTAVVGLNSQSPYEVKILTTVNTTLGRRGTVLDYLGW